MKDFDSWHALKKSINATVDAPFAHPREVWWCALGLNVGAETDGKNQNFERPVLVMKVYNRHTSFVLPITSKEKEDVFHVPIEGKSGRVWVKLTQGRVISSQRFLRKVDVASWADFETVRERLLPLI